MELLENRVIVAGSRNLPLTDYVIGRVQRVLSKLPQDSIELISGTCTGADQIPYQLPNKYPIKEFPADWDKHGKRAGPIRNEEMAKYATHLILFWDGKSRGSANMLENAKKYNLKIKTIEFKRVKANLRN